MTASENHVGLESSVAVRSLHHRNVRAYALEPHDAVHPATLDRSLALQHESELDEELSRGCEVVNHDADVIHPLDSHVFDGKEPDSGRAGSKAGPRSGARHGFLEAAARLTVPLRRAKTPCSTKRDTARAMSQENVEIVRRVYEEWSAGVERGDPGAAFGMEAVADDFEFTIEGFHPEHGREGYVEWFRTWTAEFEDWSLQLQRLIDAGHRPCCRAHVPVGNREEQRRAG